MLNIYPSLALMAMAAFPTWAMPQPTPASGYVSLPIHARKASPLRYSPDATFDKRGTVQGSAAAVSGDYADFHYMSPFQVGGQNFQVKIDTGSLNFWLLSNKIPPSTVTVAGRSAYTPGPSAVDQNTQFNVTYLDNTWVRGENYADKVVFGSQTVSSVMIGAATATSSPSHPLPNEAMSGLIGLGFASSFFTQFRSSWASNLFSLTLHRDVQNPQDGSGWLDFGWANPARYNGSITYAPRDTSDQILWHVKPDNSWAIGGTTYTSAIAKLVLLDSGTSLLTVPSSVLTEYMKNVPGSQLKGSGLVFDCDYVRNKTLPPFGISLGGTMITVPGGWMWNTVADSAQDQCWSILVSGSADSVVLGAVFHRTKFIVYDYGNNRVGFATQANLPAARGPAP